MVSGLLVVVVVMIVNVAEAGVAVVHKEGDEIGGLGLDEADKGGWISRREDSVSNGFFGPAVFVNVWEGGG